MNTRGIMLATSRLSQLRPAAGGGRCIKLSEYNRREECGKSETSVNAVLANLSIGKLCSGFTDDGFL